MKNLFCLFTTSVLLLLLTISCSREKYDYESVKNDPMGVKIYTLKNGLKLYMSVNKEQPRIQTLIGVRAGSKNEPEESTGLAHYLEHVMFKGTDQFGTLDYAKEKPMLDEIERLYEVYRATSDVTERKAIYHRIDSISYEASKLAIPNEYDKLMAIIGSDGSNAFTDVDVTAYTEDIPSNQIDNWAKVQSDRFKNMVIRGFHTELEAVYEEYNGGLTEDWDKLHDTISAVLFPSHTYKRGVIGKPEHLKSPSITNIKKFFSTYYVPNNMAICVSGDFDPDEMVEIVEKYFGDMVPNDSLPEFKFKRDAELKHSVSKTVVSPQEEYITLAWRFDGSASLQMDTLNMVTELLYNGKAGLVDVDLNLKQKVLKAYVMCNEAADYTTLQLRAYPMPGQSLDELKNILLSEVKKLRKGQFDKNLIESVVSNTKLSEQRDLESNDERAMLMLDAFIMGKDWKNVVGTTDRMTKIDKKGIVAFANRYLREDNFVAVYKRKGTDASLKPVEKPAITPIVMNRDVTSEYVKAVGNNKVMDIEPVFLDFSKDVTKAETASKVPLIYAKNKVNKLFSLSYVYDMGTWADPTLGYGAEYLEFVGTDSLSASQISEAFYRLGCEYSVNVSDRRTVLTVSGLDENMPRALALLEHVISRARPDAEAWKNYLEGQKQMRVVALSNFESYYSALRKYMVYGSEYVKNQSLSDDELMSLNPKTLLDNIKAFRNYAHEITYYGPRSVDDAVRVIGAEHYVPKAYKPLKENRKWEMVQPKDSMVYFVQFAETMNFDFIHYTCQGEKYNVDLLPVMTLYSSYFGGGMNSIVFQDMREKKALVYGAWAMFMAPSNRDAYHYFCSYAESQSDKLNDVVSTFNGIVNDMPQVEASFRIAKEAVLARLRTQRVAGRDVISSYLTAREFGLDYDVNSHIYNKVQSMTLKDVVDFQKKYVKHKPFHYGIVGNMQSLDYDTMQSLGFVNEVSPQELFGF